MNSFDHSGEEAVKPPFIDSKKEAKFWHIPFLSSLSEFLGNLKLSIFAVIVKSLIEILPVFDSHNRPHLEFYTPETDETSRYYRSACIWKCHV